MGVCDASCTEEHLEPDDDEGGYHGYYSGQWPVSGVEEPWETGVGEGDECGGEEMHEGGCNQHSCTEVLRVEDEVVWSFVFVRTLGYEGEATA